jgi:hypothetical protein
MSAMFEILNNPIWEFVGVVVAILAIGVTIILYLKQKNKKEL